MKRLRQLLQQIDGRGYKAYKQLERSYNFVHFQVHIDHVQGDPFAQPSRISVQISRCDHGIPADLFRTRIRRTALEDFLGRALQTAIEKYVKGQRGTGHSGLMEIATSGQQVLLRNAVLVEAERIEARLLFALPGSGRSVLGQEAIEMFCTELPQVIRDGLRWTDRSTERMQKHVEQVEDQDYLRGQLAQAKAVAFVAEGALLPRCSGIDDRPLADGIHFHSPASMQHNFVLPNRGRISGMAIPPGITLIVGGGFHGKSTLLQALERGVYNHIPGDGRELVVTTPAAVKIRAEDHRAVHEVDISPFIGTLPGNRPTECFSTDNASGSTSQAANIIEALECGSDCLLIDEDTSATNFMIRDQRMQQLVPDCQEPITPLLHRIRELYEQQGVSSIIVTGGSGDYLAVADTVIMLDNYRPTDVTKQARQLAGTTPQPAAARPFLRPQSRKIDLQTGPFPGQRLTKIQVREQRLLEYGRKRIDLSKVEQLVDAGQTETIGRLLAWCQQQHPDQENGLLPALCQALNLAEQDGLDILLPWKAGHLALPRLYELAAAANRIRQNH